MQKAFLPPVASHENTLSFAQDMVAEQDGYVLPSCNSPCHNGYYFLISFDMKDKKLLIFDQIGKRVDWHQYCLVQYGSRITCSGRRRYFRAQGAKKQVNAEGCPKLEGVRKEFIGKKSLG
ncbi:MAG: hypothetical protein ACYDBT_04140 [Desulfobulbaceae bacterium]